MPAKSSASGSSPVGPIRPVPAPAAGRAKGPPTATPPGEPSGPEMVSVPRAELDRLRHLATLGELLSTTTHEFNNLLTTILNYARLGIRQDGPMREKALTKILAAGQRAAEITGAVLAAARQRGDEFEPTDLRQVLAATLVLVERELQKYRVGVELDLADVPPIRGRAGQLQQVLMNLLTNARQAMPDGGRCLIRLAHDAAAGTVDLTIRDTGTGIPPEALPKIFEPFYSTKAGPDATGKGGTGIGLSHCREVIEAHRGRIRVESTVGRGTAFVLRLPVA